MAASFKTSTVDFDGTGTVITDLTICFYSPTAAHSTCALDSRVWHCIKKDLYLHTAQHTAWLHLLRTKETELTADDVLIMEIRVGEPDRSAASVGSWESRPGGIWVLRTFYNGDIRQAVTDLDVLFGIDAVDPRPQWALMPQHVQLGAQPEVPVARLSVLHGRARPKRNGPQTALRVREDGKFKIVQISDTHMVTGVGVCKDACDRHGRALPESEADPRTVEFIGQILDVEKPDLVILTGDQLHHDIPDSHTALFKVVEPLIKRSIPWAAVFGNHDSEGTYALSRPAQMSILQSLPFSFCQSGPEQVDGVGNYYHEIFAPPPSQRPLSTLYFLDSHGQIPSEVRNPDYDPIKQSQIDWFTATSQALRKARDSKDVNGSRFHISLAFLHIPIPEYGDDSLLIRTGHRREPTEGPSLNSHFYDALAEEGISAIGCGHDHVNDFCALLPQKRRGSQNKSNEAHCTGPWLCYGGGSGFGGYCSYGGERYHRRMRVWEIDTTIGGLKTWTRVEYVRERVDELVLVEAGAVVLHSDKDESTVGGTGHCADLGCL